MRGLCTVGSLRYKIDWASRELEGNLPLLRCFTSKYKLVGGLYLEGLINGGASFRNFTVYEDKTLQALAEESS